MFTVADLVIQRRRELEMWSPTLHNYSFIEEWHQRTRPLLVQYFPAQIEQFDSYKPMNLDHAISLFSQVKGHLSADKLKNDLLVFMGVVLELCGSDLPSDGVEPKRDCNKKDVFVVHGHDEAMKQAVARTLAKLGLNPIILHEQPDGGKTIIEKLEKHRDVGFAVVLLSPDDMGYKKADGGKKAKPRARQNVILELGYFIGKHGRDKVMALKREDDIEVPSDFDGVVYTPFDEHEGWQKKLVKELKEAEYNVDANAL